jgi:hypothetical protein
VFFYAVILYQIGENFKKEMCLCLIGALGIGFIFRDILDFILEIVIILLFIFYFLFFLEIVWKIQN